jgi:predicted ATP-grasp superfamily ATP-dependent carboligase
MILQQLVSGRPASVAFLCGPWQRLALAAAAQHFSADGRFRYQGGELPLPASLAERAVRMARSAVAVVPGLAGYVGVDVVLGNADDGSNDWVIELNPRLTTSYLGLRALARENLAETMVRVVNGERIDLLSWKNKSVRLFTDGNVVEL